MSDLSQLSPFGSSARREPKLGAIVLSLCKSAPIPIPPCVILILAVAMMHHLEKRFSHATRSPCWVGWPLALGAPCTGPASPCQWGIFCPLASCLKAGGFCPCPWWLGSKHSSCPELLIGFHRKLCTQVVESSEIAKSSLQCNLCDKRTITHYKMLTIIYRRIRIQRV